MAKNHKSRTTSNLPNLGLCLGVTMGQFGMSGCAIVIRRYLQNFIKTLRAVFEKFEVFQEVMIGKKFTAALVLRNEF